LPVPQVEHRLRARVEIAVGHRVTPGPGVKVLDLCGRRAALDEGPVNAGALHAAAGRLRGAYIQYISDRGREWGDSSWWTGCVAERNPFVSRAFHLLTRLAVAVDAIESDPGRWQVVCDEPAMAEAIAETLAQRGHTVVRPQHATARWGRALRLAAEFLARRVFFIAKWTRRILAARFAGARRQPPLTSLVASGQPLTIVQTWLDRRCYDVATGTLSDFANFTEVKRRLVERGHPVVTVPFVLRSVPYGRAVRAALARPEPTLLPEAYMAIGDVLRVVARSFAPRRSRPYPPFSGLQCRALFDRDEAREWVHHRRLENDLLDAMVARWRRAGLQVGRFIHTFEAHTWERVMALALDRDYPAARRIGFLAPALSRLRLNEFLTADEWARAPLPHRVVTYGPRATAYLAAEGCPAAPLVTGAAPWLSKLTVDPQHGDVRAERRAVVVLFSIDLEEARELLARVRLALERTTDLDVRLKFHPTLPYERARHRSPLPPHFMVVNARLSEALLDVPVAVYGSTGASLEVLGSGVVPVHVRLASCVDQDPLELWPDLREVADDPNALRDIVLRHLERPITDRTARRARGVDALRAYFGPETPAFYEAFVS
jgi:hypothetical protein